MNEFDDPFGLHKHSRSTESRDEGGREIRLVGPEIRALRPDANNTVVPQEYRGHPLVARQYFYTLPSDVLDAVVAELGEERFDAELLAMERRLSAICGDHASCVGFWRNDPVRYEELRRRNETFESWPEAFLQRASVTAVELDHATRIYQERDVEPLRRFTGGYCGWLMTNRQFLDEHDQLLADHAKMVRCWGTHHAATFLSESLRRSALPGEDPNEGPLWPEFVGDCDRFLVRWRLAGLAGPYLPIPSTPLMAGRFPLSVVQQLMDAGGFFFLPDTMPIPSRD